VTHGGGTANVTLNQKQNGGSWVPLGSWSFAPGSGHKVMLAAAADGTTIADAMLFVAAGAQPANLLYVHPDHLGSPQKMTDVSQTVVWDAVFVLSEPSQQDDLSQWNSILAPADEMDLAHYRTVFADGLSLPMPLDNFKLLRGETALGQVQSASDCPAILMFSYNLALQTCLS